MVGLSYGEAVVSNGSESSASKDMADAPFDETKLHNIVRYWLGKWRPCSASHSHKVLGVSSVDDCGRCGS